MAEKLITAKEASKWMGVSIVTFYRLRKEGMPYIKLSRNCVRYDTLQIKQWLENRSQNMLKDERHQNIK